MGRFSNLFTLFSAICFTLISLASIEVQAANNFHLIDENPNSGFQIYRSGKPDAATMIEYCAKGVQEMMVLSGNASKYENALNQHCPTMKIIYDSLQIAFVPLTKTFLDRFDNWVLQAKKAGKKIAFRCNCGCHRTGRLAAYYRMKFQKMGISDATREMTVLGNKMQWHNLYLKPQVKALSDFIHGRACSQPKFHCVIDG